MPDETIQSTYYRMDGIYRRCAIYFMVGLFFVAIISFWVVNYIQNLGTTVSTSLYYLPIAISLSMLIPLSWHIRVDDRGVSRRRFFRWDHWSWEDFASGRVVKNQASNMRDSSRPLWRRNLNLGLLDGGDFKSVMALINRHYNIPLTPEISDELKLKYGFRKNLILNRNGIQVVEKGEKQDYGWDDVKRIRFVRREPKTRHFSLLELSLSNREIELTTFGETPRWKGANVEEVNDFVLANLRGNLVVTDIVGETPKLVHDIENQLIFKEKKIKEYNYLYMVMAVGLIIMICAFPFYEGRNLSEEAVPYIGFALIPVLGIGLWFARKDEKKRILELEQVLEERRKSESQ